jgi:hypothetical protein
MHLHRPQRRGMAVIWVTIAMLVMVGLVGLAIDTGYSVLVGGQLQHAADAAALASAQIVRQAPSTVLSTAVAMGDNNTAANAALQLNSASDVTIGTWASGSFSAGGRAPNAVRVVPKRTGSNPAGPVPLFFGAIFGSPNINMQRAATAMIVDDSMPTLVVLDPNASCALDVKGVANLTVIGGPIQVNSGDNSAACIGGTTSVAAEALDTVGQVKIANNPTTDMLINENMPAIPDPLASLPDPPIPTPQPGVNVTPGTSVTLDPGYYASLSVSGSVYLNPGIYVIGGGGLKVNSSGALTGDGVFIYIKDGGSFDMSSQGASVLLHPQTTGTYAGVLLFEARGNDNTSKLSLNGSIDVKGILYFPSCSFNISSGGAEAGVRVIAWQMQITGSGGIRINSRANGLTDGRPVLVE